MSAAARRGVRARGFSLLEMLVVMAIIAMITSIGALSIESMTQRAALFSTSRDMATALRRARMDAVSYGGEAALTIDMGKRLYWTGEEPPAKIPKALSVTVLTAAEAIESDALAHVVFYPDGSSNGAVITVRKARAQGGGYVVRADWLTGVVKLEREGA